MDRILIAREALQRKLEQLYDVTPECRNAYLARITLTTPDEDGCNWKIGSVSTLRETLCLDQLSGATAEWRKTYVLRVTDSLFYRSTPVHLEALLRRDCGRWCYLGTWTLMLRGDGVNTGTTIEGFLESEDALSAAAAHARFEIDKARDGSRGDV